ncbi:MAG: nodulation protein NfeD [Candidatus Aminicenantes bacterium]|nr:MAG: nodulation protein NfeD [Candidatus Aminicenantes bacterium]
MMVPMQRLKFILGALVALVVACPVMAQEVVRLRVEDTIQPASQRFIERAIEDAERREAAFVVIELDTPGGLLDSTREITSAITESEVPVVVFVTPGGAQATSAGFFILISADVAAMAPGTNTGAASPVQGQGEDIGETMKAKVFSDASAMARSLAEARGRNVDLAVEAVVDARSFTAEEALEAEITDLVAKNFDALLESLNGFEMTRVDGSTVQVELTDPVIIEIEQSRAEEILSFLANPNVAYLLLALGMLGIYVEVTHPGGIFPGVVGVIAMLLALYSMSVLPLSWAGVALIAISLLLFLLEVKVTSFGLLTVGGLVCFVLGSLMLFDGPIPDMRVSLGVALPTAVVVAGMTIFLLSRVVQAHRRQVMTGQEGLVGETGKALTDIDANGKVVVHGEYWDARSMSGRIEKGSEVRVEFVGDRRIDVTRVEPTEAPGERRA